MKFSHSRISQIHGLVRWRHPRVTNAVPRKALLAQFPQSSNKAMIALFKTERNKDGYTAQSRPPVLLLREILNSLSLYKAPWLGVSIIKPWLQCYSKQKVQGHTEMPRPQVLQLQRSSTVHHCTKSLPSVSDFNVFTQCWEQVTSACL